MASMGPFLGKPNGKRKSSRLGRTGSIPSGSNFDWKEWLLAYFLIAPLILFFWTIAEIEEAWPNWMRSRQRVTLVVLTLFFGFLTYVLT